MSPINLYQEAVKKIQGAVKIAANTPNNAEGKLRELVAPIWDECLKANKIPINFPPRDERIFLYGRADTVYNRLILEYKKPYVIHGDNNKNRKLISQVQGYIKDLAKEERWKENRLLGIIFDGDHFLYIKKLKGERWQIEEPVPVTAESIKFFILNLEKLTSKAALIPDNLIKDFALGGESTNFIASQTIKSFYFTIVANTNERVRVFYNQWSIQFSEVHGTFENKKFDAETLFKSYGFKKQEQKDFNFLAFFFALDTYYAVLMKLLAYQVVGFYVLKDVVGLPLTDWEKLYSDSLKEKMEQLEDGGIFRNLSIRNFLEGDLLSWYLNDWNDSIYQSLRKIIERLNQYDPQTMELVPDETRDILKKLYQFLVPRVIRHDLGEYYTPDWLAERCIDLVGYGPKTNDLLKKRALDPGCGSGTFVILLIKRAREHARLKNIDPATTLTQITKNIMGFDLNPLAVISARTNYLLAIADLLPYRKGEITIPIYLCDSINPPSAVESPDLFGTGGTSFNIRTSVGLFTIPEILISKEWIQKVTLMLEESVKKRIPVEKFIDRVTKEFNITDKKEIQNISDVLGKTFSKLVELEEKGINGIWARIIKNAFAPLFVGKFDFIVGNPPWVNWEALPQEYRDATSPIWKRYDLFEHTGLKARSGSAKDDISVLMTYVAIDKYMVQRGKISFVITQTLFKTAGGGEGFRRFKLGKNGIPFSIQQVDDMSSLNPFEGATNRTAVFIAQKGTPTNYPVEYSFWKKKESGAISIDSTLSEVLEKTKTSFLKAQPIDGSLQSPWITAKPKALNAIKKVLSPSSYRGREGTNTGGANGIFWVNIIKDIGSELLIENIPEFGRKDVKGISAYVESELVYPLLRGRDISNYYSEPSTNILITHKLDDPSKPIDLATMKAKYPKALSFLNNFESALLSRPLYKKYLEPQGFPFYTIYNIGQYTFAPYKLVWKEQSTLFQSSVISMYHSKVIVPDHKLMLVDFASENEAHFLCSLLNSSISKFIVQAYTISTQQSTHILENVNIPKFDINKALHKALMNLSKLCHERTAAGIQVTDIEEQIDELAAELWGLTKQELKDIKDSLEELS